jgi:hypothetical protein
MFTQVSAMSLACSPETALQRIQWLLDSSSSTAAPRLTDQDSVPKLLVQGFAVPLGAYKKA